MRPAGFRGLTFFLLACACSSKPEKPLVQIGLECDSDADCVARCHGDRECLRSLCAEGDPSHPVPFCSKPCAQDAECVWDLAPQSFSCGVLADGSRGCVEACVASLPTLSPRAGFACDNGVTTACSVLSETFCETCGCPSDRPRCQPDIGCVPLAAVGEPCSSDEDCGSNHCSAVAGVCRVAAGQPCTQLDCDLCLVAGDWSFCSRACAAYAYDPDCNGGICGFSDFTSSFICMPRCTASCPGGACDATADNAGGRVDYCRCATCRLERPPT
jgi:hypothetical protein